MHMAKAKEQTSQKTIIYWVFTAGYMGIIFFLSSIQSLTLPGLAHHSDKIVHALIYIPLAVLIYFALKKSGIKKNVFLLAVILTALYGISDEYHQRYVPNRFASIGDIIADSVGAVLGSFFASKLNTLKK